ncbi:MAG: ubiquitin-like protein, partial [Bacteroidota bacterium]
KKHGFEDASHRPFCSCSKQSEILASNYCGHCGGAIKKNKVFPIHFTVTNFHNLKLSVSVTRFDTVYDVKLKLIEKMPNKNELKKAIAQNNCIQGGFKLLYQGKNLEGQKTLQDYGIFGTVTMILQYLPHRIFQRPV